MSKKYNLIVLAVGFLFLSFNSISQIKKIDKLEMLFDQGHYKIVYRKSNMLIDNPEFDFSILPKYYKSMSMLELSLNSRWFKRNPKSIDEAISNLDQINLSSTILYAHQNELIKVYNDLLKLKSSNPDIRNEELEHKYSFAISYLEKFLPENIKELEVENQQENELTFSKSSNRDAIIDYAKSFLGVPYVYAGSTPKGFDCSGFTSYVLENYGIKTPRRASDQESEANKLKLKNVQKGDLIFFNNGGGVSHVGIVISNKNGDIEMIHASSSKGIIVTDVTNSKYWSKRIHSYGTFLE